MVSAALRRMLALLKDHRRETWYTEELGRDEIAKKMNIKPASVTSYIIKALLLDPDLPYDAQRLRDLVQDVYVSQENKKRVQDLLAQVEKSPEDVQEQVK